ncbi:MAG TPA: alcohol dehydrogenase catalytic domain-containing protein [Acidimicrobiia bacterium]|nr:alcohol dehydrogenase catalytic domain-containing protein [Acidimicrobiia bacterium]
MKALVFGVDTEPWNPPDGVTALTRNLAVTPVALREIPDARPLRPDWIVTRPLLTGICGSDSKQILLDFGAGDEDNAMSGFCSFPQVMGHEVVAEVVELGPEADGFDVGQRVVLNPWLSCRPRGIEPLCPPCEAGDLSLCWNFTTGDISPGIHTGVSSDATGGYAELMPAHSTMLFGVPDSIPDDQAIFADPFAVSLHSITRHPPPPGGRALVWGAGSLGSCAVAILRALYPDVEVGVVARFDAQAAFVEKLGAHKVVRLAEREAMLTELAEWSGGVLRPTMEGLPGLPMCHPGGIDVAYDTVGKPETFEIEVRVLKARGTVVKSGVHAPGRWEWSPLYFKEINWVGSNAFGIEEVEGSRKHGIVHYLDLVREGRIDLTGMLTHTFALSQWHDAFMTIAEQEHTGAIKVAIDPQR